MGEAHDYLPEELAQIPNNEPLPDGKPEDNVPNLKVIEGGKDKLATGGLTTKEYMLKQAQLGQENRVKQEEYRKKVDAWKKAKAERDKKFEATKAEREIAKAKAQIQSLSPTEISQSTLDKAGMSQTSQKTENKSAEQELLAGLEKELDILDNRIFDILQNQMDQLRWPPLRKMKETKAHKILMETDGKYQGLINQRASIAEDIQKITNDSNQKATPNTGKDMSEKIKIAETKLAGDDTVAQEFFNATPEEMIEADEESRKMVA